MVQLPGLYVHIPFCKSKCPYCDFNSYAGKLTLAKRYVDSLLKEADFYRGACAGTVYIGGGTPTCLAPELLLRLLGGLRQCFAIAPDAEITVEANPATISPAQLASLRMAGVNRISIGVQSFAPEMLKTLGRIHTAKEAVQGVEDAYAAGFDNISLDLMFSLPGQTEKMWRDDLETAVSLPITHISCYGLKVEKGTPFFEAGVKPAEEELDRQMYYTAIALLAQADFAQYEISNFAKDGRVSRHNLLYWHCEEYIGLGAGAHSYYQGERFCNIREPEEYMRQEKPCRQEIELLAPRDRLVERLIMGLRLMEGVETTLLAELGCEQKAQKYLENGYLKTHGERIAFTIKGFDISNYILSDLI